MKQNILGIGVDHTKLIKGFTFIYITLGPIKQ